MSIVVNSALITKEVFAAFIIAALVIFTSDILLFGSELTIEMTLRAIFVAGVFALASWYLKSKKNTANASKIQLIFPISITGRVFLTYIYIIGLAIVIVKLVHVAFDVVLLWLYPLAILVATVIVVLGLKTQSKKTTNR